MMFDLMAAPFAECMVLVGIHTYLGIHVLRRRVIFVDLALAQIAAFGTMVGFLFGIMPETTAALLVSIVCTFIGAAVFALTRMRSERIPQEAVIGLVYAITAAAAVLVVEKTQGGEHLKDILVGSILWVKWADVLTAAIAYTAIGAVHFVFRRQFLLISEDPDRAYQQGMAVRAWDFFFYVTFGLVIAFSVRVAGVLLVFVFLIAPAIMAFLITSRLLHQLLIGWGMGAAVTVLGLYLSYAIDLPSGPTVVVFYGVALALGAIVYCVVKSEHRQRTCAWVATGILIVLVSGKVLAMGATWLATTSLARSDQHELLDEQARRLLAANEARLKTPAAVVAARPASATGGDPGVCREYEALTNADEQLEFIRKLLADCRRGGLRLLAQFLGSPSTPPFFRSEGRDLLVKTLGEDLGYDPDQGVDANRAALERLQQRVVATPGQKHAPPARPGHDCQLDC